MLQSKCLEIASYFFVVLSQTQEFLGNLNEIYNRTQVLELFK